MSDAGSEALSYLRGEGRRRARDLLREARLVPRRARGLMAEYSRPSFLLIGAQKSGTTSLFNYLAEHPDVRAPLWKEPRYFDRNYRKGLGWYLAHFPVRSGERFVTGEATTGYLFHPQAAARIRETLADIGIIAILRNPIDRALSHYAHERRRGGELRPMREAFEADLRDVVPEDARMEADPTYESVVHWSRSYLSRGHYAQQLRRYFDRFDREQIRVFEYQELFADPAAHYRGLLDFLGLRAHEGVRFEKHNVGRYDRDAADRQWLREHFRPHNEALADLLGRRFDWS